MERTYNKSYQDIKIVYFQKLNINTFPLTIPKSKPIDIKNNKKENEIVVYSSVVPFSLEYYNMKKMLARKYAL